MGIPICIALKQDIFEDFLNKGHDILGGSLFGHSIWHAGLACTSTLWNNVSFAEYRLFYRALLQKRPVILRNLLIEATPKYSSE